MMIASINISLVPSPALSVSTDISFPGGAVFETEDALSALETEDGTSTIKIEQ